MLFEKSAHGSYYDFYRGNIHDTSCCARCNHGNNVVELMFINLAFIHSRGRAFELFSYARLCNRLLQLLRG